jgi:ABC-type antimicrobial peptide transport system permease subunit
MPTQDQQRAMRVEALAKVLYLQTAYLIGITLAFFLYTVWKDTIPTVYPPLNGLLSVAFGIGVGFGLSKIYKRRLDIFY